MILDKPVQKKYARRFPHRDIAGKLRIRVTHRYAYMVVVGPGTGR
jgi:hypothetical protein